MPAESRHSVKVMLALGTIYLVWGSSFLFTKIAVGSLPPALFSGIRFVAAGTVLALVSRSGAAAASQRSESSGATSSSPDFSWCSSATA